MTTETRNTLNSLYGMEAEKRRLSMHDIAVILMALEYLIAEDEKFIREWKHMDGVEPMIIRTTQEIEEIRELKTKICLIDW